MTNKLTNTTKTLVVRLPGELEENLSYLVTAFKDRYGESLTASQVLRYGLSSICRNLDDLIGKDDADGIENLLYWLRDANQGRPSPWQQGMDWTGKTHKPFKRHVSEKVKADFERVFDPNYPIEEMMNER